MRKSDFISIMVTLIVGLFAGAYLYLTGFAPVESEIVVPEADEASQFIVVSDSYGGCRDTCPSFQVVNDGSYRFLYVPTNGTEKKLLQGKLPFELHKKLRSALIESELVRQSETINPLTCGSYSDGVDILYEITLNGKTYTINSCGTAVDGKGELWITLSEVWDYFGTI